MAHVAPISIERTPVSASLPRSGRDNEYWPTCADEFWPTPGVFDLLSRA